MEKFGACCVRFSRDYQNFYEPDFACAKYRKLNVALESEIFEFGSNIGNFVFFHKRGLTVFKISSIDDWMR